MPTYRSLGNDLYEIEGPGGRRIPVRLAPGQLEASGYTPEPMGGLEAAGFTPQAMPRPQAFAGPGAADLGTYDQGFWAPKSSPAAPATAPDPGAEALRRAEAYEERKRQEAAAYWASRTPAPAPVAPPPAPSDTGAGGAGGTGSGRAVSEGRGPGPAIDAGGGTGPGVPVATPVVPAPKTTGKMPKPGEEEGEASAGRLPFIMPRGGGGGGGGPPPGTLVPGRQDVEFTRQDPEAMERLRVARTEQAQDVAARLLRTSQQHTKYAETLRQEAQEQNDIGKMQRARYNDALADFERERAAIAAERIDPNRYYTERGVIANIFAAIMRGAGEWAATRDRSGRNPVAEIIDNAVDRDIDAQKANHAARMQGLSTKMTILDKYMQNNDPKDAEAIARALKKEVWVHELEASGNEAALAEVQSSARADIAELEAKAGMQKVTTTLVPVRATGGGGGGGRGPVDPNILVKAGMAPEMAMWVAQNDPKLAGELQKEYFKTGATMAAKGMAPGGIAGVPNVAGFQIKDPKFARQAVGLEAVDAGAESMGKKLLESIRAVRKAPAMGREANQARMQLQTDYQNYLEARGKVDMGVNASGTPLALREYIMPKIAREIGPDVSESVVSNVLSRVNPMQMSNLDRLEQGVRRSMGNAKAITKAKIGTLATGKQLGGAESEMDPTTMLEEAETGR